MRTTIVPAQITTVEDKIAGNLGLSQILLLISPIFGGSAIFVILPPFFSYSAYKVGIIALVALFCGIMAVRIKGQILLFWVIAILRFNVRPMYYVFDKNSTHLRDLGMTELADEPAANKNEVPADNNPSLRKLTAAELTRIDDILTNPTANVHFTTTKKGEIRVHLTEVAHEILGQTASQPPPDKPVAL